jgi:DnaJ-class molecular chaperone
VSKIMDMAEAEAAEAEAAEDDETTSEGDQADDEAEAVAEASPANVEKAMQAMEKENVRHAARVRQIMGADFDLVYPCSHCADFAAGFTLTAPETQPEMLHGADYLRCAACNGYGLVLTGALAEHGQTQTCLTCNGQGFVTRPAPLAAVPNQPALQSPQSDIVNQLRTQGYMVIEPPADQRPQAG